MLRRYCRTCGSGFTLDDNEVHTKCPRHRSAAHSPPVSATKAGVKAKGKRKSKH